MIHLITGLPRSGKGTFCKSQKGIHLNLDTIRKLLTQDGLYSYPYDSRNEHRVLDIAQRQVAQFVIDNPNKDVYVDDYALLYDGARQKAFMLGVKRCMGLDEGAELSAKIQRIDTHPAECIKRLTLLDCYLAPVIMAQAVQDMAEMLEAPDKESKKLLPGIKGFTNGLYDATNRWQVDNRDLMDTLDPNN